MPPSRSRRNRRENNRCRNSSYAAPLSPLSLPLLLWWLASSRCSPYLFRSIRNIVPPEILVTATYPGADAKTVSQAVSTPLEQQMNGVDNMIYMDSVSANNGVAQIFVDFDVKTDPNIDQVLAQLRVDQAQSQLPAQVTTAGLTVQKALTSPLMLVAINSPDRPIEPGLSHQLRHHQSSGPTGSRKRRVSCTGFWRPICAAGMG